jgi:hypothetical protein
LCERFDELETEMVEGTAERCENAPTPHLLACELSILD